MKVTYALLCDYAIIGADAKVSMIGIFSTIRSVALPATHPRAFLGFGLELEPGEEPRPFGLAIALVEAKHGETLMRMEARSEPIRGTQGIVRVAHQILPLPPFTIKNYGIHKFQIFLADDIAPQAEVPFAVDPASTLSSKGE